MVRADELAQIHERMAEAGILNAGAYVRKMTLIGYILLVLHVLILLQFCQKYNTIRIPGDLHSGGLPALNIRNQVPASFFCSFLLMLIAIKPKTAAMANRIIPMTNAPLKVPPKS